MDIKTLTKFRTIFPHEKLYQVTGALINIPSLWSLFEDPNFFSTYITFAGKELPKWSPASIALRAINYPTTAADLALPPLKPLHPTFKEKTIRVIESSAGSEKKLLNLIESTYLALALREKFRINNNWNAVFLNLPEKGDEYWHPPLTILLGIVPNINALLAEFVAKPLLLSKCLFSIPSSQDDHINTLLQISHNLPDKDQLNLLKAVNFLNKSIAKKLGEYFELHKSTSLTPQDKVDFLSHTNQNEAKVKVLEEAVEENLTLHKSLVASFATSLASSGVTGKATEVWQKMETFSPMPTQHQIEYLFALLKTNTFVEAAEFFKNHLNNSDFLSSPPNIKYIHACLKLKSQGFLGEIDSKNITNWAEITLKTLHTLDTNKNSIPGSETITVCIGIAEILLHLGIQKYPNLIAKQCIHKMPQEISVYRLLCQICESENRYSEAIQWCAQVIAMDPNSLNDLRSLAKLLEINKDLSLAYQEWQNIVELQKEKTSDNFASDLKNVARLALVNDSPQYAIEICNVVLNISPNDIQANLILGDSYLALGSYRSSVESYQRALEISNESTDAWIKLADFYSHTVDKTKAIETLKEAVSAVPTNPALHFRLGELFIEQKQFTQALSEFSRALNLAEKENEQDNNPLIRIGLAKVQKLLGHHENARSTIEPAYQANPKNPEICKVYSEILIELNLPNQAKQPLANYIDSAPTDPEAYLALAEILINDNETPEKILPIIQAANNQSEKDSLLSFKARTLLAEAYLLQNNAHESIKLFKNNLNEPYSSDVKWRARLHFGFGKASLALIQPKAAIAAFQESIKLAENNPKVFMALSEAYLLEKLPQHALSAARSALQMDPNTPDTYIWFLEQTLINAQSLLQNEKNKPQFDQTFKFALSCINKAAELSKGQPKKLYQLGYILAKSGNKHHAKDVLTELLEETPSNETCLNYASSLHKSVVLFQEIGEYDFEALALEKAWAAIEHKESSDSSGREVRQIILQDLCRSYLKQFKFRKALEIANLALEETPEKPNVYLLKAEALLKLGKKDEFLNAIVQSEEKIQTKPELITDAAALLMHSNKLNLADEYINKALKIYSEKISTVSNDGIPTDILKTLAIAVEISYKTIQFSKLRDLLSILSSIKLPKSSENNSEFLIRIHQIGAIISFDLDEEIAAAHHLTYLQQLDENNKLSQLLQHRLILRQENYKHANEEYRQFLNAILRGNVGDELLLTEISKGYLELGYWENAVAAVQHLNKENTAPPIYKVQIATTLLVRAEALRICKLVEATTHCPTKESIDDRSWKVFIGEIKALKEIKIVPQELLSSLEMRGYIAWQKPAIEIETFHGSLPIPKIINSLITEQTVTRDNYDLLKGIEARFPINAKSPIIPPLLHSLKAEFENKAGLSESSIKSMQIALNYWQDEPRWHSKFAKIIISSSNDYQRGLTHYQTAVKLEPNNPAPKIETSLVYINTGRPKEAIKMLQEAKKIAPELPEPLYYLAQAHFAMGEIQTALSCSSKAIELNPRDSKYLLLKAQICLSAENPNSAYQLAQEALELDPENTDILILITRGLEALDRPTDAITTINKALPLSNNPLPLHLEKVRLVRQTKGAQAALSELKHLASLYPDQPTVLLPLVEALGALNEFDAAITWGKTALELNSKAITKEQRARLNYLLGRFMRQKGNLDLAIEHLKSATELTPNFLDAVLELGHVYQEVKQLNSALEEYYHAIKIAPTDPRPYTYAGLTLKDSKNYSDAKSMIQHAIHLAPDDIELQRKLGMVTILDLVHNREE